MRAMMSTFTLLLAASVLPASLLPTGPAVAMTLKIARAGDALSLDPHAQNEGPTHNLNHQIYEPLVRRHHDGSLVPTLAVSWGITADPRIWEIRLRGGVTFHDGTPFTADDAVYSIKRAMSPTSDMKGGLTSIEEVVKVDDLTIRLRTKGPNPLLIQIFTNVFMMSKAWAERNKAEAPQNFAAREETFAVRNAMGTGAYALVSREPDVRTVLRRHEGYWGKGSVPLEASEVVFTVIKAAPTRVAALLSGEVDIVQDMPVQDIARVASTPGLRVDIGAENRSIFFGLNVGEAELKSSDIKGRNPLADVRVRRAMSMAIDRTAIKKVVMADQSAPSGTIVPPFTRGHTAELAAIPRRDIAKAKELMAAAGYGAGFSLKLHCTNDRYLNDEKICQAAVGMLGQIGIKAALDARSKSIHFPQLQKREVDFYMIGWGVPTYDSEYMLSYLVHTQTGQLGGWNATGYSNPAIDAKIRSLGEEIDIAKRDQTIAEIWRELHEAQIYIPVHNQVNAWGMKAALDAKVHPDNTIWIKDLSLSK